MSKDATYNSDVQRALSALYQAGATGGWREPTERKGKLVPPEFELHLKDANQRPVTIVRLTEAPVLAGGNGLVFQCHLADNVRRRFALKVLRPSLLDKTPLAELAVLRASAVRETEVSKSLSHINVVRTLFSCDLAVTRRDGHSEHPERVPVTVSEWIDDARPLTEHILERVQSREEVVRLMRQALRGLQYLHAHPERPLVHWDMKSDNCLVGGDGILRIADFGSARELRAGAGPLGAPERVYADRYNLPPWLTIDESEARGDAKESRRVPVLITTQETDGSWLDLFMLGRTFQRIFGWVDQIGSRTEVPGQQVFLERMFGTGSDDGVMARQFLSVFLDRLAPRRSDERTRLQNLFYFSEGAAAATRAEIHLKRMLPFFGSASSVAELQPIPQHVLREGLGGNVPYSRRFKLLLNSRMMRSLCDHMQLGLTRHAYAGATHVRHEHVMGVANTTLEYVRALYADRTSAAFRLLCDAMHVRAVIFAAIIHDLGHVAFSHYLEELEPLFARCSHEDYAQEVLRGDGGQCDGRRTEAARDRGVLFMFLQGAGREWLDAQESAEEFLALVARILRPVALAPEELSAEPLLSPTLSARVIEHVLHSIVDGDFDADKHDYLARDSHHAGLGYGAGGDPSRLMQALTVAVTPPAGLESESRFGPTIAVTPKGVLPIESFLLARYHLFVSLYWQHTARAATSTMQQLICMLLGCEPTHDGFVKRRDWMFARFRQGTDRDALRALEEGLLSLKLEGTVVRQVRFWVRALMDRLGLPVTVCELGFEEVARDSSRLEDLRRLLKYHALLSGQTAQRYLALRAEIVREVWRQMELGMPVLGETRSGWVRRAREAPNLSVFVDIPLPEKDQVRRLYVVGTRRSGERQVRRFSEYSPMADAVRDGFRLWARRVRVFVPRGLARQIRKAWDLGQAGVATEGQPGAGVVRGGLNDFLFKVVADGYYSVLHRHGLASEYPLLEWAEDLEGNGI